MRKYAVKSEDHVSQLWVFAALFLSFLERCAEAADDDGGATPRGKGSEEKRREVKRREEKRREVKRSEEKRREEKRREVK